jgi:hypothetical protein
LCVCPQHSQSAPVVQFIADGDALCPVAVSRDGELSMSASDLGVSSLTSSMLDSSQSVASGGAASAERSAEDLQEVEGGWLMC